MPKITLKELLTTCRICKEKSDILEQCEDCHKRYCDDCWWAKRAFMIDKTTRHIPLERCKDCNMKRFMRELYPIMYDKAVELSKKKINNIKERVLWFDPRYWTNNQIKKFFCYLNYLDYHTWECISFRLSKSHNIEWVKIRYYAYCKILYDRHIDVIRSN